ncbi:hypothetical protein [Chondrinema litorale]|uniref:hypothetical protein n=1 Tax=Chondrinema litorale TaxID=2994555 RepID=UPI0025434750|nr:hypothetical protein [Chondrinema litorale]UZR93548.1 hypothetical protein OQ292_16985 [Chondrinema litorale]
MKFPFIITLISAMCVSLISHSQSTFVSSNMSNLVSYEDVDSGSAHQGNRKFLLYNTQEIKANEEKVAAEYASFSDTPILENDDYFPDAFIAWGTLADLAGDGLLQRGGKWSYEKAESYNREEMEMFLQVNSDSTSSIRIPGVLKRMLTLHDASSYKINKGEYSELRILNKDKFWENGHFLVVVVE